MKYWVSIAFMLLSIGLKGQQVEVKIDYETFLSQHDMLWDIVPHRWEVSPYTGNGNVGFLFFQAKDEAKNVISIYTGRHDHADHREGENKSNQMLWIYRSRLPLGHFNLSSKGDITGVDLRLSLWNAELTGTVYTSEGSYQIKGYSHSGMDVIYFETKAKNGEAIKISWHPEDPIPPVWLTLQARGEGKPGFWEQMRTAQMEMPPKPTINEENGQQFCYQPLYKKHGETTTGWEILGEASGKQTLITSIHHSFPEHNSMSIVKDNLQKAKQALATKTFETTHQQWWHDYYPLSFLTINDAEKEAFYWIQMYKFASASRSNGPIMDLMGPWYHRTFWPMVWGDLNVELQYWTPLAANRLSVGESLANNIDKYTKNLEGNVPDSWENSASIAALFPQDLIAYNGNKVPDMLAWILHGYWLHCQFAGDYDRMRDNLFPLLKKTMNAYLNYLKDNPIDLADGKIHIKNSWSPEYPGGHGTDMNFTIGLIQWTAQTLIDIDHKNNLNDSLLPEWQNIVDNIVEFQIDENGLRVGREVPFDKPHRHYSHLLPFYPLALLTTENDSVLVRKTLDHWLDVTINNDQKGGPMPVTGYTATGAASMYAALGDADKAYYYLDFLLKHKNVSPTTMYAEGNPVIESPLSFATCVHDMLIQSMGGVIKVFPGTPERWGDAAFYDLRAQGAFLVSAKKKGGVTRFVSINSLIGSPLTVKTDIDNPRIFIIGKEVTKKAHIVQVNTAGLITINVKKGETVVLTPNALKKTDLVIEAIPVKEADKNLFGFSKKTERLPGHNYYLFKK
jgi:alpha-L-fucosidase 2